MLAPAAVASSSAGGDTALVSAELSLSVPALVGTSAVRRPSETLTSGTLHWGVPFDSNWSLDTDGVNPKARPSFGSVMAFDLTSSTQATLRYETSPTRFLWVISQGMLWTIVILAIVQPRRFRRSNSKNQIVAGTQP
jgi:hypothetical protein